MRHSTTDDSRTEAAGRRPIVRYRSAEAGSDRPASRQDRCELILAAAPSRLDARGEATTTFRASEPGHVDLGRLLVFVSEVRPFGRPPTYRDERVRITSIEIFIAHQKVRGLGEVEAPAGVFSTFRRQQPIDLGRVRLAASDTLEVTVRVRRLDLTKHGGSPIAGMAVPFQPDTERRLSNENAACPGRHVYLASAPVRHRTRHAFQLTLAPEEDGVVDLASLQLAGASCSAEMPQDPLPATLVESIRLPSAEDLILGNRDCYEDSVQAGIAVPATLFAHLGRMGPWVDPGRLRVLRGQQITLRLRRRGPDEKGHEAVFSAGLRFYPSLQSSELESRIQVSDFFRG